MKQTPTFLTALAIASLALPAAAQMAPGTPAPAPTQTGGAPAAAGAPPSSPPVTPSAAASPAGGPPAGAPPGGAPGGAMGGPGGMRGGSAEPNSRTRGDMRNASGTAPAISFRLQSQNESGETGTATLQQRGRDLIVYVIMNNVTRPPQPIHIHKGTCANLDPKPAYALTNVVERRSMTTIPNLSLRSLQMGTYAINVHESVPKVANYVSCGDIPKLPPGAVPGPTMAPKT